MRPNPTLPEVGPPLTRSTGAARRLQQARVLPGLAVETSRRFARRQESGDEQRDLHARLRVALSGVEDLEDFRVVEVDTRRRPWLPTGLLVAEGDEVTMFRLGRVHLSRPADLWLGADLHVWARVGGRAPLETGTRATHTFVAAHTRDVQVRNCAPAEWIDRDGEHQAPAPAWLRATGSHTVALLRWRRGVDVEAALREAHKRTGLAAFLHEAERLADPGPSLPDGWEHRWQLGPSEIFAAEDDAIGCRTRGDVGIIHHELGGVPLTDGTELRWSWRVDELPSALPENTLATHDYMSVAVEFSNGLDLTYHWSAGLPVGTVYPCPLPHWCDRETHAVVRSGPVGLGEWLPERRRLLADYRAAIGDDGPARVERVWLIATSVMQRRLGRCAVADITVTDGDRVIPVGPQGD